MRLKIFGILFFILCLPLVRQALADLSGSMEERYILERIKPMGELTVEGAAAKTEEKAAVIADVGQHRYEQTCKLCHEPGLAGAPKLGDKKEWQSRLNQGMETVIKHAIQGLKAMPPKGGCATCSDEEITKAVEYMVQHSK